jgi:hypothetical protein
MTAARVRGGSGHVGFVVDKVALRQVFSEYFGFPCLLAIHRLLHDHHHLSSGARIIGQNSDRSTTWTASPHEKNKKVIKNNVRTKLHSVRSQKTVTCDRVAGSWAASGQWLCPSSRTCLTSGHSSTPHSTP